MISMTPLKRGPWEKMVDTNKDPDQLPVLWSKQSADDRNVVDQLLADGGDSGGGDGGDVDDGSGHNDADDKPTS